jgi:tetratricopeptide repeat protein
VRSALAIGLLLVIAGCQRAPVPPPRAPAPAVNHLEEAKKALAVADWATAAPHLRAALQQDPDSLFLHYNLALCATWLDLTDEAVREFDWVLAHAASDSDEVQTARNWLRAHRDRGPTETAGAATPSDPAIGDGGVHGVITDSGSTAASRARQQLFLVGLKGTPTQQINYVQRSDGEGRYEFKRITPGQYKLTDAVAGPVRWRLKVVVESGQDPVLDLTPENGVARRDDFPESQ